MHTGKVTFKNKDGQELHGDLILPVDRKPHYFAIFAHCFTCGKDISAIHNISLALSQKGLGVLRFDFTGLGRSDGEFSETNFTSNIDDIKSAADYLSENYEEPSMLIGHSFGGTAVLLAGSQMDSIKAIVSIAAPGEPDHVLGLLNEDISEIKKKGKATVSLADRDFEIKEQFIDDVEAQGVLRALEDMRDKALLIIHSPQDKVVDIINARNIYMAAHHPKSFVSLDGADHLMSNKEDSLYAGNIIASWAERYLPNRKEVQLKSEEEVLAVLEEGPFLTQILAGPHHMLADEPEEAGGSNLGPTPYEFLAAGLGACTAMTIKMYTDRKKWPLKEVKVHLTYNGTYKEDCENCEDDERRIGRFERTIELEGELDEKQKERILRIANKCPVHKTLTKGVDIKTELKES